MRIFDRLTNRSRGQDIRELLTKSIELTKGAIDDDSREKLLEQHLKLTRTPKRLTFRQRFQSALRSMKLALLSHLFITRSGKEKPKIALHQSRRMVLLHSLLHTPPLIGAVVLIALNLGNYCDSYTAYDSTGLQFVSKFHELLMQASIGAMLLDFIRSQNFDSHLPLGFLFAPTQVSTVSYLWSLDYWSALTAPGISRKSRLVTGLLAFLALALAALVGPSSAVAMIPRHISSPRNFHTTELLLEMSPSATFLSDLSSDPVIWVPPMPSMFNGLVQTFGINPQLGSNQNLDWTIVFQDNSTHESAFPISSMMSVTIQEVESDFPKGVVTLPKSDLRDRMFMQYIRDVVLAPNSEIRMHANAVTYSLEASHTAVSVRCHSQPWLNCNDTTPSVQLPNYNGSGTSDLGPLQDLVGGPMWNWSTTWVPPPQDTMYSKVAITRSSRGLNGDAVITCGVRAAWEPAKYEIRGSSDMRTIQSTLSRLEQISQPALPISMSTEWTEKLQFSISETNGWLLDLIPYKSLTVSATDSISTPFEVYLAAIVAQGVSSTYNISFGPPYGRCTNTEVELPEENQLLDVDIAWSECQRGETCPVGNFDVTSTSCDNLNTKLLVSVYGYGVTTISVILSLVVLFLYSTLVFVYIGIVLLRGTTSTALDTTAELVTLALQSRHPKYLGSTSVGIESMETLRAPVGIRVNSEKSLELVFRDDPEQQGRFLTKVEADERY